MKSSYILMQEYKDEPYILLAGAIVRSAMTDLCKALKKSKKLNGELEKLYTDYKNGKVKRQEYSESKKKLEIAKRYNEDKINSLRKWFDTPWACLLSAGHASACREYAEKKANEKR